MKKRKLKKKYSLLTLSAAIISVILAIPFVGQFLNTLLGALAIPSLILSIMVLSKGNELKQKKTAPVLGIIGSSISLTSVLIFYMNAIRVIRIDGFGQGREVFTHHPLWLLHSALGWISWIIIIIAAIFFFIQYAKSKKELENEVEIIEAPEKFKSQNKNHKNYKNAKNAKNTKKYENQR